MLEGAKHEDVNAVCCKDGHKIEESARKSFRALSSILWPFMYAELLRLRLEKRALFSRLETIACNAGEQRIWRCCRCLFGQDNVTILINK
jgi:hypothetical protein